MKKKYLLYLVFIGFGLLMGTTASSCKVKEGCKSTEKLAPKVDKNGQLSTKRGKSNLFSKKQRKKMKN